MSTALLHPRRPNKLQQSAKWKQRVWLTGRRPYACMCVGGGGVSLCVWLWSLYKWWQDHNCIAVILTCSFHSYLNFMFAYLNFHYAHAHTHTHAHTHAHKRQVYAALNHILFEIMFYRKTLFFFCVCHYFNKLKGLPIVPCYFFQTPAGKSWRISPQLCISLR